MGGVSKKYGKGNIYNTYGNCGFVGGGGINMRHMFKYISISLLFLLAFAGCATAVQQESVHYYNIYDEQGKRKGYLKESGGNITIYDENWKRKGQLK